MNKIKYTTILLVLVALGVIGYWYQGNTGNTGKTEQVVIPKLKEIDHSPIVIKLSEYSKDDQSFLLSVRSSARETQQIIIKLEELIAEAQENDELMEATESMTDAKKQILFQWNSIHNGYKPKDQTLIKLKTRYEAILDNYREGIAMELDGMEQGQPPRMKAGFEATSQAKKELQELLKVITG